MTNLGSKTIGFFALLLTAASGFGEREPLWPAGKMPHAQAGQIAAMKWEAETSGFDRAAHAMPYLEWFDPPASNRTDCCMLLISGGGYYECYDQELIDLWRERLTAFGIRCVSLVYRTPRPVGLPFYQSAWEDGQRAVRLVRSQAKARGFNPEKIGAIAMSAGSHLTLLLATSSQTPAYQRVDAVDELSAHLNWAVTGAIAYALSDGLGTLNTREGIGPDVRLDGIFKFDAKTCPMCLFHGGADAISPFASTLVYRELHRRGIPTDLHILAGEPHCFRADWCDSVTEFLRQMNFDGKLQPIVDYNDTVPSAAVTRSVVREPMWPAGKMPDVLANQPDAPYLEWHLAAKSVTKAIQVILPGGAYIGCNESFEGWPLARRFNAFGMSAVVVCYRHPRPLPASGLAKHTPAWEDAQRALRKIRHDAPKYGLDPGRIGVLGLSAGGHLALMCATSARHRAYLPIDEIDREPCNVQWAIPIYPAYVLTDGVGGPNAHRGDDPLDTIVPDFAFDLDTPPMCLMHGNRDEYSPIGSVQVWERLRRMGLQSDLHVLAKRGHAFWIRCSPETGSYNWMNRIWKFLSQKGLNK